jgi:hypothetical protein
MFRPQEALDGALGVAVAGEGRRGLPAVRAGKRWGLPRCLRGAGRRPGARPGGPRENAEVG